jgi:hypothetical protein
LSSPHPYNNPNIEGRRVPGPRAGKHSRIPHWEARQTRTTLLRSRLGKFVSQLLVNVRIERLLTGNELELRYDRKWPIAAPLKVSF